MDAKETAWRYLRNQREAVLWKVDGLGERDLRIPLTPTGTNLLGLVKHVASIELGYFGETFGRPSGIPLPWFDDDAEPNADMWATPGESRESNSGVPRRSEKRALQVRQRSMRRALSGP